MKLSDFDYNLDESLIAQVPSQKRENSRLMHLIRKNEVIDSHSLYHFSQLFTMPICRHPIPTSAIRDQVSQGPRTTPASDGRFQDLAMNPSAA